MRSGAPARGCTDSRRDALPPGPCQSSPLTTAPNTAPEQRRARARQPRTMRACPATTPDPYGSTVPRAFAIRPAARSVWPRTSDLGALDLSARSGADRVYDSVADQAGVGAVRRLPTRGRGPRTTTPSRSAIRPGRVGRRLGPTTADLRPKLLRKLGVPGGLQQVRSLFDNEVGAAGHLVKVIETASGPFDPLDRLGGSVGPSTGCAPVR